MDWIQHQKIISYTKNDAKIHQGQTKTTWQMEKNGRQADDNKNLRN